MTEPRKRTASDDPQNLYQHDLHRRMLWAWLIVNGWKPVDKRSRRTNIRGRILIHAGLKFHHDGENWVRATFPAIPLPGAAGRWKRSDWQLGGIAGEGEVTAYITKGARAFHPEETWPAYDSPWFSGPFGYVLANARPLPFIPCRGMLGFLVPFFAENASVPATFGQAS